MDSIHSVINPFYYDSITSYIFEESDTHQGGGKHSKHRAARFVLCFLIILFTIAPAIKLENTAESSAILSESTEVDMLQDNDSTQPTEEEGTTEIRSHGTLCSVAC